MTDLWGNAAEATHTQQVHAARGEQRESHSLYCKPQSSWERSLHDLTQQQGYLVLSLDS
jgi:hypothetical protein